MLVLKSLEFVADERCFDARHIRKGVSLPVNCGLTAE